MNCLKLVCSLQSLGEAAKMLVCLLQISIYLVDFPLIRDQM
jgi:hypothetical protein